MKITLYTVQFYTSVKCVLAAELTTSNFPILNNKLKRFCLHSTEVMGLVLHSAICQASNTLILKPLCQKTASMLAPRAENVQPLSWPFQLLKTAYTPYPINVILTWDLFPLQQNHPCCCVWSTAAWSAAAKLNLSGMPGAPAVWDICKMI